MRQCFLNVWSPLLLLLFFPSFHAASADETALADQSLNDVDTVDNTNWIMTNEDDHPYDLIFPELVLVADSANCKKARRGMRLSKRQRSESCSWQDFKESTTPTAGEAGAQPRIDNARPATEGTKPAENATGNKNPIPVLNPPPKRINPTPAHNSEPTMEKSPKDPRRVLPGYVEGGSPCNKGFSQVEYSRYKYPVCYPLQQGTVRISPFSISPARWQYYRYGMDLKGGFIRDLIWPCRPSELTPSSF